MEEIRSLSKIWSFALENYRSIASSTDNSMACTLGVKIFVANFDKKKFIVGKLSQNNQHTYSKFVIIRGFI